LAVQSRSGSSKVDDFGKNRKRVGLYDFLLVCHCDYSDILHRFRDGDLLAKIAYFFLPLPHSVPSLPMFSLKFWGEVNREET